jgi:hypothetical protein
MQRAAGSCTVPASFPHPLGACQAESSRSSSSFHYAVREWLWRARGIGGASRSALDEAGQSLAALVVVLVIAGVPRSSSRVASKLRSRLCNSAA